MKTRTDMRARAGHWLLGGLLTATGTVSAAEFGGTIELGVANTDNVRLVTAPLEESETIYQLTPSFSFSHESQRIDTTVLYRFQGYKYQDLDTTSTFHQFDGRLTAELIRESLFVDVGAVRSQALRDPDEVIPNSSLPLSDNLVDRDEYFINPRFNRTIGRNVTVDAGYRVTDTRFGEESVDGRAVQDNTTERANVSVENYKANEGLTWALRYNWEETDYDFSIPWEYRKASAELGFWVNGNLRVFGSGGQESAWDDFVDRSLADPFWEAGFAYSAGEKFSAEFAGGERSFGNSWRGDVSFNFRRGNMSFSYAETPTTNGQNRFRRGSLANPQEPDDFLDQAGTAERYIAERLQWTLGLDFRRTGLDVTLFDEQRSGRFRADGTPAPDESQRGVTVMLTWQVGARTEVTASGSQVNRESEGISDSDYVRGAFGVSYRLGNSTSLALNYDYSEQDQNLGTFGRDYVANTVSLNAIYTF